jgi:hypothetical protein
MHFNKMAVASWSKFKLVTTAWYGLCILVAIGLKLVRIVGSGGQRFEVLMS